jgi:hypothetical protein
MWFAFGFVTLIAGTAYLLYWRWSVAWTGISLVAGGIRYHRELVMAKDRVAAIRAGVPVPKGYRFELKRESATDRFFKWLGLSVEYQFGQDGFDKLVYVASNDDHLFNRLANSPALRAAAVELFQTATPKHRLRGVFCAHGQLWVDVRNGNRLFGEDSDAGELSRIAEHLLPHLEQMAKSLREVVPTTGAPEARDRFLFRAIALLSVSSGLAANGVVHLLRTSLQSDAFTIDTRELWTYATVLGALVIGSLLVATVLWLGRSARAHLILIELALVGSFGAVLTSWVELRDINMELDTAASVAREALIVDRYVSRSRKGGTRYYVKIRNWTSRDGDTRSIQVSSSFYSQASMGRALLIDEYPGRIGIRWATIRGLKSG